MKLLAAVGRACFGSSRMAPMRWPPPWSWPSSTRLGEPGQRRPDQRRDPLPFCSRSCRPFIRKPICPWRLIAAGRSRWRYRCSWACWCPCCPPSPPAWPGCGGCETPKSDVTKRQENPVRDGCGNAHWCLHHGSLPSNRARPSHRANPRCKHRWAFPGNFDPSIPPGRPRRGQCLLHPRLPDFPDHRWDRGADGPDGERQGHGQPCRRRGGPRGGHQPAGRPSGKH